MKCLFTLSVDENDWVKKYKEYEVDDVKPRGRAKKTWRQVVEKDCFIWQLNRQNDVDHSEWRKLIKDIL